MSFKITSNVQIRYFTEIEPEEIFFKISTLQRRLIVAGICVLLLLLFYWLVISDMRSQIDKLQAAIRSMPEIEITNQKNVLAEGPKLLSRIKKLEQKLQTMVAYLCRNNRKLKGY